VTSGRVRAAYPERVYRVRRALGAALVTLLALGSALSPATPAAADTIRDQQWYLASLGVPAAHASSRGDGVTVAVLDSGVDGTHPDLVGSVLEGIEAPTNSGNGQQDPESHGTGMAAIIAGHGHGPGNGSGMLGIAPGAKILPVKLGRGSAKNYTTEAVIRGIEFAVERGAKVISASINVAISDEMRFAVYRALDRDVVFIAGSGNIERGFDVMGAPAVYPGVMAICGSDRNGNRAPFSATAVGLTRLAVCAPAVDGINANPGGGYTTGKAGTSMSTAIVAGVAALIRSKYPDMPGYEVSHRIRSTAIDKGPPGVDKEYGHGLLNLNAALTGNVVPTTSPTPWIKQSASPSATAGTPTASASGKPSADPPSRTVGVLAAAGLGTVAVVLVLGVLWLVLRRRRGAGT